MDRACQEILMATGVTESSMKTHTFRGGGYLEFWTPSPSRFFELSSWQGPVPGSLSSRTPTPHTTQNWVLASFRVDPGVQNRRNLAPYPDCAARSRRPLAAPGGPSSGDSGPLDPGTLHTAPGPGCRSRLPPEAAQAGIPGGLFCPLGLRSLPEGSGGGSSRSGGGGGG